MLKTRVLTAAVLLAVFGAALFLLPQSGWIAFCAAVVGAAAWEWGALAGLTPPGRSVYTASLILLFLAVPYLADPANGAHAPAWVYAVSGAFWILVAPLWIWRSRHARGRAALLVVGVVMLVPAGAALVDLRGGHPALLLAVLGTVWIRSEEHTSELQSP